MKSVMDILVEGMARNGLKESFEAKLRQRELRDEMLTKEESRRKDLELLNAKPLGNA